MSDLIVVELDDASIDVSIDDTAPLTVALLDAPITIALESIGYLGAPGVAESYTHTQSSAASTWTVPHNLGFRPAVTVTTVGGLVMYGEEIHLSTNTLQILFVVPVSGTARCV